MTLQSALLVLPSELIEAILICSCSPRTVTSIAQTCQALHKIVYGSSDSHLWRELFLTTWDDPRPALEHRSLLDPRVDPTAWDWGAEYRRRVSADRWLKAWRRDIRLADDGMLEGHLSNTEWHTSAVSTLSVVLSTLLTLRPFSVTPPTALTVLTPTISSYPTGNVGSGAEDRRERITSAPPLPPLLVMLANDFQESRSGMRIGRMIYGPHASRALVDGQESMVTELAPIPTPSLPPQLVRTLLASYTVGVRGLPGHVPSLSGADTWGVDPLGRVFHQIICTTGFVPIPPPLVSTSTSSPTATATPDDVRFAWIDAERQNNNRHRMEANEGPHRVDDLCESDGHPIAFPTPSQQHADARTLARRRVYDMRYLRGDRLWGPYQIVTRESLGARPEATKVDANGNTIPQEGGEDVSTAGAALRHRGTHRLGTLAWAIGLNTDPDDFDTTSDEEWHESADTSAASSSSGSRNQEREQSDGDENTMDVDLDVEMEPMEPDHPLISLILATAVTADDEPAISTTSTGSRRRSHRSNSRLPRDSLIFPHDIKPHHLRPDYTYLASVRIVVEANLRDLFGIEISDDITKPASEVRAGGIGMFWEDEDEILRTGLGSFEPATLSCPSSSPTMASSGIPAPNTRSASLELSDIFGRFRSPEAVRLGSACGYWSGWDERQWSAMKGMDGSADALVSSTRAGAGARKFGIMARREQLEKPTKGTITTDCKGKGKEKDDGSIITPALDTELGDWEVGLEGEACEGWDWAGVAGIWRRCICWMDYRELLFFNLDSTKFLTLDAQEACRIIPMEIRITGFTRAELMPVYDAEPAHDSITGKRQPKISVQTGYFRPPPIIHFSSTSVGSESGWYGGRTTKGSVHLIGGGEIRWQMESTLPGTSTPEWSSEAVQVGGIGSAVGLLGMWTGAGHERADPLGPFWAWKVT